MITESMLRMCRNGPCAAHLKRAFFPANLHTSRVTSAIQLKMPSLSPTMTEGTIVKWLKVQYCSILFTGY